MKQKHGCTQIVKPEVTDIFLHDNLPDLFMLSCHIKTHCVVFKPLINLHGSVTQNLPSWIVFCLLTAAAPLHQRCAIFGLNTHLLKSYMYMYVLCQLRLREIFKLELTFSLRIICSMNLTPVQLHMQGLQIQLYLHQFMDKVCTAVQTVSDCTSVDVIYKR